MPRANRLDPTVPRGSGVTASRLPIIEHIPIRLEPSEADALRRMAEAIRREDPTIDSTEAFGGRVDVGDGVGPNLFVHDTAAIQEATRGRLSSLEHRSLPLAGDGDAVALSIERVPGFEEYCRAILGLGSPEILRAAPRFPGAGLAAHCRRDPIVLARMTDLAVAHGGVTVQPYMGSGGVWALAGAIAERAGVAVRVAAPPPRLTRHVNDKLWFARRAAAVLGERSLPRTTEAHSLAVLAARVRALARGGEQIALKLPSAAGGSGNVIVEAAPLRDLSLAAIRDSLARLLLRLGWRRPFPLLISIWESPVIVSPSIQLWVPHGGGAMPVVEGIFEQQVEWPTGEFVGAAPTSLPRRWQLRIAREAVLLATLFRDLGYYGRCSFDAILVGRDLEEAELHWVECNGRWGGTSIPMTLANRLTGDWARSPFVVSGPDACTRIRFDAALRRTQDRLFTPGAPSGIVFLSPGRAESGQGIAFLTIARSVKEARQEAAEVLSVLRSPGGA